MNTWLCPVEGDWARYSSHTADSISLLASGAKKIYPAHGSPFMPAELTKNKHHIRNINLRPLKRE